METTTKKTLKDLIVGLIKARIDKKFIPEKPVEPELNKAYTISEWNVYVKSLTNYQILKKERDEKIDLITKTIQNLQEEILDTLPTAHVWFLTDDKRFAIAIQKTDWPMSEPEILIEENPVIDNLPKLKLRLVSSN